MHLSFLIAIGWRYKIIVKRLFLSHKRLIEIF